MPASNSSSLSREKRSTSRRQRKTSCTTMISAFRRAGALPVVIACAWAETNVYPPGRIRTEPGKTSQHPQRSERRAAPAAGTAAARLTRALVWRAPASRDRGFRTVPPQARHGCASDFDCCMPVPAVPDRLEASSAAFSTRSRARSTSRFSTEATAASIHAPNISGTTAISPHTIT